MTLKVRAGIPDRITETVYFEVAHFDPRPVTISVEGIYAALGMSLPRVPKDDWPELVASGLQLLEENGSRLIVLATQKKAAARGPAAAAKPAPTPERPGTLAVQQGDHQLGLPCQGYATVSWQVRGAC